MDTDTRHAAYQTRNHPEILNLIAEIDEFTQQTGSKNSEMSIRQKPERG